MISRERHWLAMAKLAFSFTCVLWLTEMVSCKMGPLMECVLSVLNIIAHVILSKAQIPYFIDNTVCLKVK